MTRAYYVTVCLKATLTVRVDADSQDAAEDVAHDAVTEAVQMMGKSGAPDITVAEDDRAIHRVLVVNESLTRRVG